MPRYFSHRTDGHFDPDEDAVELASLEHARNAAVIFAGETLRYSPRLVRTSLIVEVTDVDSLALYSIHITKTRAPMTKPASR